MDIYSLLLFSLCIVFPVIHLIHSLPWFKRQTEKLKSPAKEDKGISILIPCYNEQGIIDTSIFSMKSLSYSEYDVIYINDGSADDTMLLMNQFLQLKPSSKQPLRKIAHQKILGFYQSELYPHIYVIDKVNGGKADSLNAGIEFAQKELVITLDADTILTDKALPVVNDAFEDENVVAAGGMVHVLQTKTAEPLKSLSLLRANLLVSVQALDFLKAFYITKMSLARFHALAIISGAFGIFKKQVLIEVGGFRTTIGEDIDITLRIHRHISNHKKKKIIFIPEAVCYTELPENWKDLFKQRIRWQKAFIDCVIHFRGFLGKTLFKKPVSFFYLIESFLAGTIAAYVMTGLIVVNGMIHPPSSYLDYLLFFFIYILIFGLIYDLAAVRMSRHYGISFKKREIPKLLVAILFDVLIYRLATMIFIMYGSIAYFFNQNWNKVERTGRDYQTDSETAA